MQNVFYYLTQTSKGKDGWSLFPTDNWLVKVLLYLPVLSHFDNMHKFFNKQQLQENGVIYDLAIKTDGNSQMPATQRFGAH